MFLSKSSETFVHSEINGFWIVEKFDHQKCFSFDRPGIYRICVQGFLHESWSERLSGMRIRTENQSDKGPVTTLVGSVPDQAALFGVVKALYDLHLTLLSVEMLEGG